MNKTPKTDALFAEVEALYPTQLYHRGDYCAKVRALHELMFYGRTSALVNVFQPSGFYFSPNRLTT